jgi:hypothetical protein
VRAPRGENKTMESTVVSSCPVIEYSTVHRLYSIKAKCNVCSILSPTLVGTLSQQRDVDTVITHPITHPYSHDIIALLFYQ